MQDIIRLLPDSLVNQIAAGEVVQRPASAVKELMENSIDAGGDHIELIIRDHGKGLIQVVDNGSGMSETDARMALERHATSKINNADDLFRIRTMGFRGEALASIAAVSQLELRSRPEWSELGTRILVEGSDIKLQEACAVEKGCSISVRNLFYNVPARRNFLKSNGVEMKHIIDEFQRISLAHPEKSFSLYQEDTETYRLSPGKLSQRIIGLFGKNYKEQLVKCNSETDLIKIRGYVGKPEASKKTRGEQFLFVNHRYIRSNYLNHAVKMAYESLIPEDQHPFYVLFLEVDPEHIDVNVHPTKTEIKFDDERTVYAIVRSAVKQALGMHNVYPSLDFDSDVNLMKDVEKNLSRAERDFGQFKGVEGRSTQATHWETLFDENLMRDSGEKERIIQTERDAEVEEVTFSSRMDRDSTVERRNFIQVQDRYILSTVKSGFMIIDQRSALERIYFEKLMARSGSTGNLSQQVLFPVTVEFSGPDFALVNELKEELRSVGFEYEEFGKNAVIINGIPADIGTENEKGLLEGLVEQYKFSKDDLKISRKEKMLRILAKRAASNNLRQLSVIEMEELVNRLFGCENANYTPDGRATFKIIENTTIENFFR